MTSDLVYPICSGYAPTTASSSNKTLEAANIIDELPPVVKLAQHTRACVVRQPNSETKLRNYRNKFHRKHHPINISAKL